MGSTTNGKARLRASPTCEFRVDGLLAAVAHAKPGDRLNTEAREMVATIERAFAALGDDDPVGREEVFCEDFHAFENGIRMTGRELVQLMSRYRAAGRRYRWSVDSPQIEVQGDLGVVVYENRGFIAEAGAEAVPMSWL